jgi:thiamine pyrophosphate-dependent acetolactate synthase large subunit-like protein
MNGAESLVRTLLNGDVNVCFANPGTSEMHFASALDRVEGVRCILGLFEGVVTGAADGYYRMTGKPALATGFPICTTQKKRARASSMWWVSMRRIT